MVIEQATSPVRASLGILMVLSICVSAISESRAQGWDVGLDADLGIIYSDNIFLDEPGEEESDVVYLIAPEFYAIRDDERIEADIRYRPEAVYYSEFSDSDQVFHVLDASFTGALVKEKLFLYLGAANFQTLIVPEGRIPTDNIQISDNRTDSFVYEIRPYWDQRFGDVNLLLSTSFWSIDYDDEELQDSEERSGRFRLDNFARQQGIAWQLAYTYREVDYEISQSWEFQRAELSLGYWINGKVRLFGTGGQETSFDNLFESNMDADFWETGFQYAPNERLNLELAVGDRSYGQSYRGSLTSRVRRGFISLSYSDGPATRSELIFDRRPILDKGGLDGVLDESGATDRFVLKRGEILLDLETAKTEIVFRVFAEDRINRTTAEGDPLDDERIAVAEFDWSWRVGSRTSIGFGLGFADRETLRSLDDGTPVLYDDKITTGTLFATYSFGERASLRAEYRRREQSGEPAGVENQETQYRLLVQLSL